MVGRPQSTTPNHQMKLSRLWFWDACYRLYTSSFPCSWFWRGANEDKSASRNTWHLVTTNCESGAFTVGQIKNPTFFRLWRRSYHQTLYTTNHRFPNPTQNVFMLPPKL